MVFFPVVIILTRIVFFSFYYWHIFLYVVVVVVVVVVMDRCSAGARIFSPVVSPLQIWSSMAGMNSSLLTSTLKLSLSLSLFFARQFLEKETTRLASVRFFFFFFFLFESFFIFFSLNSKICPPNQILKCPIFGAHIENYRNSWTVWWRLWTPHHPISSVASSPTRPSLLVNDQRPLSSHHQSQHTMHFEEIKNPPLILLYSLSHSLTLTLNSPPPKKKSKEKHKTLPGPRSCCVTLTEELIVNIWNLFHLKNGEKNNRPKRSNWITWWRRSDPRRPISSVASSPTRPNRPVRERWHSSGWVLPVWPGEYPRRVSFFISRLHEKQNGGEFYTTPVAYHPHFTLLFSSFFAPPPPSPPLLPSVEMSAKNWRPSIFLLFSSRCYRFSLGYAPADM